MWFQWHLTSYYIGSQKAAYSEDHCRPKLNNNQMSMQYFVRAIYTMRWKPSNLLAVRVCVCPMTIGARSNIWIYVFTRQQVQQLRSIYVSQCTLNDFAALFLSSLKLKYIRNTNIVTSNNTRNNIKRTPLVRLTAVYV